MADNKRFFWIKLRPDFFNDPYIKLLRRMAGGDTYTIIYLKMLVKSAPTDGVIYFQGAGADISEELALTLDESIEDVRALLAYLEAKNLITHPEITQDLFLVASADLTGSEVDSAQRVRKFRERQQLKALQSNTDVTNSNDKLEKELEIEKELDKDKKVLSGSNEPDPVPYKEIIDYLNEKTGKRFKSGTDATKRVIRARFKEGNSLDDFKAVIDVKATEWIGDSKMEDYLRPSTLFGTKFEGYLNQSIKAKPVKATKTTSDPIQFNNRYDTVKDHYIKKFGYGDMPLPTMMPAPDNTHAWELLMAGDDELLNKLKEVVERNV